ncbi:signal transduction histidine kinase [Nonomuraea thailandensis]|uniref:histidine kinase n=2 Tax=Nonomuraea thailandensis TaxID=1188745 RepID=A0A9X2GNX3_9ACTN|nr:histidine kinase [Nonomuraea thailandensis]MCP2362774.1 signal transduction histidine kinase [Nonomuraea thailandensis]
MKIVRFFQRPKVFDRTLVIVLAIPSVLGAVAVLTLGDSRLALGNVHYLLTVLPLLWRRNRPITTMALVAAVDTVCILTGLVDSPNVATTVALYSLSRFTTGRTTVIASAVTWLFYTLVMELGTPIQAAWATALFMVAIPVGLGQLVRLRAELNERGRREVADAAVRAERRRIARELHDVVAHHITVINALVGGARATLPAEQAVTREALESAEQTARQAMSEMRRLLDVLRADGNEGPDAATGVGADRLPALIKEARSAGLPAHLTVTGEPVELPAAVDHAVYRIVQEALTNTRKHAAGARASVRLAYESSAVEVEVLDDGLPKDDGAPGFGLGGMAERVALCGGQLSTGPRPEGGFRVHARLPLEKA